MIKLVIFGFFLLPIIAGSENHLKYCSIYGDPYLTPFVLPERPNTEVFLQSCDLPNSKKILFRNEYATISVTNSGSQWGTIIDFTIQIPNDFDDTEDCFITPADFQSSASSRFCGSAAISRADYRTINIQYERAKLNIQIDIMSFGVHYKIQLWTSSGEASRSRGMCQSGCPIKSFNIRSLSSAINSRDSTISSLASQICDIYLREFQNVPKEMNEFIQTTRNACVNDLMVTGDRQFAEEAVSNVATLMITKNATSLADVKTSQQKASTFTEQILSKINSDVARLIADYTAKQRLVV